jgi:hypothetical protein
MAKKVTVALVCLVTALVSMGADSCSEATDEIDKADKAEQRAKEGWSQVSIGDSQGTVRTALGSPSSTQTMQSEGYSSECWYWGVGSYQICFDETDHVDSKNRY